MTSLFKEQSYFFFFFFLQLPPFECFPSDHLTHVYQRSQYTNMREQVYKKKKKRLCVSDQASKRQNGQEKGSSSVLVFHRGKKGEEELVEKEEKYQVECYLQQCVPVTGTWHL